MDHRSVHTSELVLTRRFDLRRAQLSSVLLQRGVVNKEIRTLHMYKNLYHEAPRSRQEGSLDLHYQLHWP